MRRFLPPRPFARSHWSLLAGLVCLWVTVLAVFQCSQSLVSAQVALITATLFIALWHADLRRDGLQTWPRVVRVGLLAAYDLVTFVPIALVAVILYVAVSPFGQCYSDRMRISEALLQVSQQRLTITDRATEAKALAGSGKGLVVEPSRFISGGFVSPDGAIFVVTERPPAVIVLRPRMNEGRVDWDCSGLPAKSMPVVCRDPIVWNQDAGTAR